MKDDSDPGEYDLAMPFVVCTSKGGPYDDDAYTAGWSAGAFDRWLAGTAHHPVLIHGLTFAVTIAAGNVQQFDLIAMRHGYHQTAIATSGDGEYAIVTYAAVDM